jgi:lipopolysaccharide biosynthesis glycosyltransferase
MSAECAVCYVADLNFLLPSLVSAAGLRQFVPAHKADIFIFLVDGNEARIRECNQFLQPHGIRILAMNSSSYSGFDRDKFHKSGVPTATLGRFFIDDLLPDACQRIVYIDGDTWMWRDPSALIEAVVPDGKFAAAEDMTSFRCSNILPRGRALRPYFKNLGLNPKDGYFNAGIFATSRNTWKALASEAFEFFRKNTAICKYHDQSALNAVMGDRRLHLSLKWNFQTPYRFMGIEKSVKPRIYHFHSQPKPWMGASAPWQEMYSLYQAALAPFDALNLPIKKADAATIAAHNKLNWRKNLLLKSPLVAKIASLHTGIHAYESKTWL